MSSNIMERFVTYTKLEDALVHNVDIFTAAFKTCWKGDLPAPGRKFLDAYLKEIIDPSLLYRMHPATSRMATPYYYKYGIQFFRFPKKLLDIITNYCCENFPNLWATSKSCEASLDCILCRYRKIRATQMRAYIANKVVAEPHPMFAAIAWDTWKCLGVFRSPAPLWSRHTATDRDAYMAAHLDKWNQAVADNGLEDWSTTLPGRWAPEDPARFGSPPETVNESYWPYP